VLVWEVGIGRVCFDSLDFDSKLWWKDLMQFLCCLGNGYRVFDLFAVLDMQAERDVSLPGST